MDYPTLQREWRRLYRTEPPNRTSRNLLLLGVAWKIQEQTFGGLGAGTKRRLADLARTIERGDDVSRHRARRLKPGAKLLREWRGESHMVLVLDNGFEWRGRQWRSLSAIAREITSSHWSGPRFFGLTGSRAAASEPEEQTDA
jgi:hypothetical protein